MLIVHGAQLASMLLLGTHRQTTWQWHTAFVISHGISQLHQVPARTLSCPTERDIQRQCAERGHFNSGYTFRGFRTFFGAGLG